MPDLSVRTGRRRDWDGCGSGHLLTSVTPRGAREPWARDEGSCAMNEPEVQDQVEAPAEEVLVEEVSIDGMCGVY
ncbi:hypothetical protein GCM10011519_29490 [Marmoricola endophyticus]|uniref:Mycofactocin n=1 Tax=Marmoricola endophyticus TaxID=2040280 RepID=A0A917BR07_9ACTN|nr:hypothetical protein GCM10011519_29490 [Marmoricola endophyticus]